MEVASAEPSSPKHDFDKVQESGVKDTVDGEGRMERKEPDKAQQKYDFQGSLNVQNRHNPCPYSSFNAIPCSRELGFWRNCRAQ